jgi:hypothetical protein
MRQPVDNLPTRKTWLAEWAVFLSAAAVTLLVCLELLRRLTSLGGGDTTLLLALSAGVGIFVSSRFRAWGLRRKGE